MTLSVRAFHSLLIAVKHRTVTAPTTGTTPAFARMTATAIAAANTTVFVRTARQPLVPSCHPRMRPRTLHACAQMKLRVRV